MATTHARLEGFAREHLILGRGEWWIVREMVRRSSEVDETEARAIVARVAPGVHSQYLRRRRRFLAAGLAMIAGSLFMMIQWPQDPHAWAYGLPGIIVGGFLWAHGRPGLRRRRSGDAPTSLPGSVEGGPVRTGLSLRAEPFEWK